MKSLITADEARALNKDMRIYVNLVERIKTAALNGNVQTNTSFMSEDLQNRLEMDGFKVKKIIQNILICGGFLGKVKNNGNIKTIRYSSASRVWNKCYIFNIFIRHVLYWIPFPNSYCDNCCMVCY